ncbi:hypothetical protein Efla_003086 [Eimeria flavescens]
MDHQSRSPSTHKASAPEKVVKYANEEPVKLEKNHVSFYEGFSSKFSSALGLPLSFFQSRPEIRTWGEEDIKDPSVQPRADTAPKDYGSGLPGYPKSACAHLDRAVGRSRNAPEFVNLFTLLDVRDNKLPGPRLRGFPKCKLDFPPLPTDKLGTPTYDYRDLLGYRMDYHPYVNATMTPQDPSRMYVHANWMVGYPYGVPAVEENARASLNAAERCW